MHNKPKIIFVGDYNRTDYVRLLEASKDYCDFSFLFFTSPREELNAYYQNYGCAVYWKDFNSAQQLIAQLRPDKVVFLYIESYNHEVLYLACREAGVATYLLEHGLRADYVVGFDPLISPSPKQSAKQRLKYYWYLFRDWLPRVKSHTFLKNSLKQLQPENRKFAEEFLEVRKHHNYLQTSKQVTSFKRTPETYISFSPGVFAIHQQEEGFSDTKAVHFIGVPYFDHLAYISEDVAINSILFIDQPLSEQGLLGWTYSQKKIFAEELANICNKLGYELLVKLHPVQNPTMWQLLSTDYNVRIVQDDEVAELAPHIRIVLGFYSTYFMPFAALDHITVITYENHPAGKLMVSRPLLESGVAHAIYKIEELEGAIYNIAQIHIKQKGNKEEFKTDWLYKFDGRSGERLKSILTSVNQDLPLTSK